MSVPIPQSQTNIPQPQRQRAPSQRPNVPQQHPRSAAPSNQLALALPYGDSSLVDPVTYANLRSEAVELSRKVEEERQKYDEYRAQLDAKFQEHIAPLEERAAQTKDRIEMMRNAAVRWLEREETKILGNSSTNREQKRAQILSLRKSFESTYEPNDEYKEYTSQNSIESLLSTLFGGMMLGGIGAPPAGVRIISTSVPPPGFHPSPRSGGRPQYAPPPARESEVLIEEVED